MALDANGRPLTGVITWADTRSAAAATALRARLDETAVHARTGAPLHSTFYPAKLIWLREARPDVFARAATWCGFAEYLLRRLTGCLRASLCMASGTGLLDQRAGAWDIGMLDACGIGPERLPPIDDAPLIGLAPEWRARWPALAEAPWLPAAGDGACSNLGMDCSGPDRIALNVGTSAALRLVTPASSRRSWPTRWGYPSRCVRAQRLRAAGQRSWPWVRSAARLPHPSRPGLSCAPTHAVATPTPPRELARTACTTALWGPAYLERIGRRQETCDPCESRSAVTTPAFR